MCSHAIIDLGHIKLMRGKIAIAAWCFEASGEIRKVITFIA